eukprot:CAMPEP_0172782388 /NCGR_PEP_ID=MMETSP1074-20121228/203909_1 /TAXON_ID=2916 /ORGANISM="Ceratium fusus, Strain PA161109" /LENGTH=279 /DNA_ID=CAMNT_0013619373 /DNA_START=29 /DNA_END=869 /DNA_ORIENTATION=+
MPLKCSGVCAPVCGTANGAMSSQTEGDTNDLFRFLKDEGTKQVKWTYVGEGKGNFTPMMVNYNYVGHGRGTFDKEAQATPANSPPCSKEKIYVALGLLMFVLTVLALFSMPSITRGVRKVIAEQEASRAHDCQAGSSNWEDTWSDEKKQWCCDHHGKACPADETGCGTLCNYLGKTATCRYRIKWGAEHRFAHRANACVAAYRMVQEQCDIATSASSLMQAASQVELSRVIPRLPIKTLTAISALHAAACWAVAAYWMVQEQCDSCHKCKLADAGCEPA